MSIHVYGCGEGGPDDSPGHWQKQRLENYKVLFEGGVKPALSNSKPRSYWWMEGAVGWNPFFRQA